MSRIVTLPPSKHPVIESIRNVHTKLKINNGQPLDKSFEAATLCTSLLLETNKPGYHHVNVYYIY